MATNLGSDELTARTDPNADPWQEALSRWYTVPAAHVIQAAEVIRGLAGSWAASYQFDYGAKNDNVALEGNPQQVKSYKLGRPGFPELNFRPYDWGTNRFGTKGGSFIGHPIAFDVVGPTAQSNFPTLWYWDVTIGTNNDALTLNAGVLTIPALYGFADLTLFDGGLYVVITETGSGGQLRDETFANPAFDGGVGDGINLDPAKNGIQPLTDSAKYEIFRVVDVRGDTLILDTSKRLSSYFTIPADPTVRSIMLLRPKATRLVAIPGSGTSPATAKAFAVVPPKRALMQDTQFPYYQWVFPTGWTEWNLPQYNLAAGNPFDYVCGPQTPIPRPLGNFQARLLGVNPYTGASEGPFTAVIAGHWVLFSDSPGTNPSVGQIIRINSVRSRNGAVLKTDTTGTASDFTRPLESLMGWFEIAAKQIVGSGTAYLVRRVPEKDPNTGFPVLGSSTWYTVDDSAPQVGMTIEVEATVHNPIETLWRSPNSGDPANRYPDIDAIQSARLTNLIDPRWVERSTKNSGRTPARADRAVFDTASSNAGADGSNANPGSLLDLGFRMVLFPAKVGQELDPADPTGATWRDVLVPDWDNPVTANEVPMQGEDMGYGQYNIDHKEYVEVDYANGLVRVSDAILKGKLYPDAAVFTADDNPRGEMVLFACCVPYSQEEGQTGANIRVMGGQIADVCNGSVDTTPTDAFSQRIVVNVDPSTGVLTSTKDLSLQTIELQGDWVYKIPPSGYVELLKASDNNPIIGDTKYRGSLFEYVAVSINPGRTLTRLVGVSGGGEYGVATWDTAATPTIAVFRKEVVTPNNLTGDAGVAFQYDTTYGAAKRASALVFEGAPVTNNIDGTATVTIVSQAVKTLDYVFSSWVLDAQDVTINVTAGTQVDVTVPTHTILMRGRRMVVPESTLTLTNPGFYYIYYQHTDGTTCPECLALEMSALATPALPDPEDILLAKVYVPAGIPVPPSTYVQQLQNPLKDVDRRVDLYVGDVGDTTTPWTSFKPHFKTVYEAVQYANEIMSPVLGSRYPTRNVRIVVMGRTVEPYSSLPIKIETDGLIIEGTPHTDYDDNSSRYAEITWGEDPNDKDLFDLNGKSDLVFRNLSFRSRQQSYDTGCTARIFMSSSNSVSNLTIDNCRSVGFIKDFVNVSGSGATPTHLTITNNVIPNIQRNGFRYVDTGALLHTEIRNNVFTGYIGASRNYSYAVEIHSSTGMTPETVFMDQSLLLNFNINIVGNTFHTFNFGIWAITRQGAIRDNFIYTTGFEGIVTCGGFNIHNNTLSDIYTGNPNGASPDEFSGYVDALGNYRYGIIHFTYLVTVALPLQLQHGGSITNNTVELSLTGTLDANDKAIILLGSATQPLALRGTGGVVQDNVCRYGASVVSAAGALSNIRVDSENAVVRGNLCYGLEVLGDKIKVAENNATQLFINILNNYTTNTPFVDGRYTTETALVTDNTTTGYSYLWSHTQATDNHFGNRLYFRDHCTLTGNFISNLYDFDGVGLITGGSQYTILTGNEISRVKTNGTLKMATRFGFTGNRFGGVVTIDDATTSTITGNGFLGGVSLGATVASTNIRFNGNIVQGDLVIGSVGTPATLSIITGNQIYEPTGTKGITAYSTYTTITSNNTLYDPTHYGFVTVTGNCNVVEANLTGNITVTGTQSMIRGNHFFGNATLSAGSAYSLIANNIGLVGGAGIIYVNDNWTNITGNFCNKIQFGDGHTNSVLTGNMVQGDIYLGSSQANQVDPVTLIGNMITGNITNVTGAYKADSSITYGNHATIIFGQVMAAGNSPAPVGSLGTYNANN